MNNGMENPNGQTKKEIIYKKNKPKQEELTEQEFQEKQNKVPKDKKKNKDKKNNVVGWVLFIFIFSIVLTTVFSFLSEIVMDGAWWWVCAIVTLVLIFINVLCDLLSVAVTSCPIEPFLAMASSKVKGAKRAVSFVKNADKFATICADVCGDVCGIVSGTASTAIVVALTLNSSNPTSTLIISIAVSAIVGGLTVGGKALGKVLAVRSSKEIVLFFAKITAFFKKEK